MGMRHWKKYVTNPKESLHKKYGRIKRSLEMKKTYVKSRLTGDYTGKSIPLSWEGKPRRYDLVNAAIKQLGCKNYLEIGCFRDETFSKIVCENKTGVDPLMGGNVRMTSDDFFKHNTRRFDCIFVDGLHTYGQVRKDILNSIDALENGGVIIIDDSLPLKYDHQTVPASNYIWNGDVWKAVVEMRIRNDIDVALCTIDHGLGIIKKRPASRPLRFEKLNINGQNFNTLKYADLVDNYEEWMNTMSYEQALEFIKN